MHLTRLHPTEPHWPGLQKQFINVIVMRSYEVALFLYGPQEELLTLNSNRMLMAYKNYQGGFSVLSLGKINSNSIIIGQSNFNFPFHQNTFLVETGLAQWTELPPAD